MIHARQDYNRIQDPAGLIPADEPVFLIRAKDKCAPATVRAWAMEARQAGADNDIVFAAFRHADLMEAWQRENGSQVPDMPR
jgi:hypothetical protein